MEPFTYVRAKDTAAAVQQASGEAKAEFLAGGTTLIDLMKLYVRTPRRVVDINPLPLTRIEETANSVRIGAMVRNTELAYHDTIRQQFPVLSQAVLAGATAQVRNMATVGGNLLQRTRCTYYRDTFWPCNKREPGSGCSALEGFNRSHALLGTSDKCIATHPSDMCVALAALDAIIHIQGTQGERSVPLNEFYIPYGDDPAKENVLQQGDLITAVEIPKAPFLVRSHYLKVRDRSSFEFALVAVAAALEVQNGTIRAARLALGGVATKPWRATEAEKVLVGAKPEEAAFTAAAKAALRGARPQKHNAFKVELARRAMVRALSTVGGMA
jgi:xanthine dehydrogenase YagS FAD-binding subunit